VRIVFAIVASCMFDVLVDRVAPQYFSRSAGVLAGWRAGVPRLRRA